MGRRIDSAGFTKLFTEFTDSAFRLETLNEYHEAQEQDAIRRFIAGQEPDDTWMANYLAMLRGFDAHGKRLRRVRVLDRPPSDYQRFVLDLAHRCNIPAGEELRVLDREDADSLGVLADSDFWLFDDLIVAAMTFDDGRFVGAEIITDTDLLLGFRDLRARTWEAAREFTRR